MRKKIVILLMIFIVKIPSFAINENNPIELLNCYFIIIKRAIEEQKWNSDFAVKDSLCASYLSSHQFVIDKDTLKVIPDNHWESKHRLKFFLISDSVAIVQLHMDTVFANKKEGQTKKHNHKNSYIELSVTLDSSKETGVRVDFGNPTAPARRRPNNRP